MKYECTSLYELVIHLNKFVIYIFRFDLVLCFKKAPLNNFHQFYAVVIGIMDVSSELIEVLMRWSN